MELIGPHFCATMYTAYRVDLNTLDKEGKFLPTFQDFAIAIRIFKVCQTKVVISYLFLFSLPDSYD